MEDLDRDKVAKLRDGGQLSKSIWVLDFLLCEMKGVLVW